MDNLQRLKSRHPPSAGTVVPKPPKLANRYPGQRNPRGPGDFIPPNMPLLQHRQLQNQALQSSTKV